MCTLSAKQCNNTPRGKTDAKGSKEKKKDWAKNNLEGPNRDVSEQLWKAEEYEPSS